MENWPVYFKDRLTISNLNCANAVACLWTPKDTIEKLTIPETYCVLGQLYTKKGINYLLRNILANPFIKNIYLVGNDLMQSGEALVKFFENGVDENYKIIGDDSAVIDKEISLEKINLLRKKVSLVDLRGADKLTSLKTEIKTNYDISLWSEPEIFDEPPPPDISVFPSEVDLMRIRRSTISEAYLSVLKHVMQFGLESEPVINYVSNTSKSMKELLNLSVIITEEDVEMPNVPSYMPFSATDLDNYYKGFFNPDKMTEDYTYGERLFNFANEEINELKKIYPHLNIDRFQKYFPEGGIDQVAISIIRKLQGFKHDKGAIALLGNPFTDVFPQRPSKKIPCLFLIQCQIYQDKLNMTAYFRSNDMYNAWPLNAFALRKLQKEISEKLDSKLGSLITISNMAHIYEHNYSDAKKIIDENYKGNCEWDPRGNIIVEVINEEIVAKLISPEGTVELREWRIDGMLPHAARDLSFLIDKDLAVSTFGNALYLGRQFERAETAIKLKLNFKQDNALDFEKV